MAEAILIKHIPHGFLSGRRLRFALTAAIAAIAPVHIAHAQTDNWIGGSGNWTDAASWSAGLPTDGETVNFIESDGVGRTINYDESSGTPALGSLTIDLTGSGAAATNTFLIASNSIGASSFTVGLFGSATIVQSGGVVAPSLLYLAVNTGSTGAYVLTGTGTLSVFGLYGEIIGANGLGEFNQSGGTNTATHFELGANLGSTGAYNLSGTGSLVCGEELLADSGTANFYQSGGTNNVNDLFIGGAAKGTYSLCNTGSLFVAGSEVVGGDGIGIFNQTGGIHAVGFGNLTLDDLIVGYDTLGMGIYLLSGTGSLSVTGDEVVGGTGHGTFYQAGGTNITNGVLYVGEISSVTGAYFLSGTGSLTAALEYIGYAGNGTFTQTGGSNSPFSIGVAQSSGSTGAYTLSGTGSLLVASDSVVGVSGTGTFIQSGGDSEFSGNLLVGYSKGSSGAFTLNGGVCNVYENLSVGGHGKFPGGAAIFNVNGPSASLNVSGAINVFNTPGSGLYISAGAITAASLNLVGGPFTQSGGTTIFSNLTGSGAATLTGGALTLSLGGPPSQLGSVNITSPATLDLQLGGYTQGVTYDLISLANASSLGGRLELDLVNGFVPQVGDQFTVMTDAAFFTGQFNNLASNMGLFTYTVDYGASHNLVEITVTSVPEPASLGILLLGGLSLRRRRRKT